MSESKSDSEVSSSSQESSCSAYYEFIHKPDPSLPPISNEALHVLISQYKEVALHQEECGCFADAESHWRKAYSTSKKFFPDEKLTTEIAMQFGLFLSRFLPASRQTVLYLRAGLAIDPEFSEFFDAWLSLAKSLAAAEEWQQAKDTVKNVMQRTTTMERTAEATNCLGRILLMEGDLRNAEEVLTENLEGCRRMVSPHPELLGEALTLLGALMLDKEKFSESELLLSEAVSALQNHSNLVEALRLLAQACEPQNRFEKIDAAFDAAIADMKQRTASSYRIAEVLVAWGDTYLKVSSEKAALYYLLALSEYKTARPDSCYVAKVLEKLTSIDNESNRKWTSNLKISAQMQLRDVLLAIPTVSTLMTLGTSKSEEFLKKMLILARDFSDAIVSGEALIFLITAMDSYQMPINEVMSYCDTYPNTELTVRLSKLVSEKSYTGGLGYNRKSHHSCRDEMRDVIFAAAAHTSAVSSRTFEKLYNLASSYEKQLDLDRAEECYSHSFFIATALNPISCRVASALLALGKILMKSRSYGDSRAKIVDLFIQAFKTGLASNPLSTVTFSAFQELNNSYVLRLLPHETFESLKTQFIAALDSQCPPGTVMSLQLFDKLFKKIEVYRESEYLLLKALEFSEGVNFNFPILQQLSAIASPFCLKYNQVSNSLKSRLVKEKQKPRKQAHSMLIECWLDTYSKRWSARKKELVLIRSISRKENSKFLNSLRELYFRYR